MVVLGVNLCCVTLETNVVQSAYLFTGLESVKFFYVMEAMYLKALWPKHDAKNFNTMMVARMSLHCELDQTFLRGALILKAIMPLHEK